MARNTERFLEELMAVLRRRKRSLPADSYTAALFRKGRSEILKKIGEEAFEVALASVEKKKRRIVSEIADLWFHSLVLMVEEGIRLDDILRELGKRKGQKRRKPS